MNENQRRKFLKDLGLTVASASFYLAGPTASFAELKPLREPFQNFLDAFKETNDRVWIGEKYWSIPMEDWEIKGGRLECRSLVANARVNLLTSVLNDGPGEFTVSGTFGFLSEQSIGKETGSAGFSVGIKDDIDSDVKAACYYGKGLRTGISLKGILFIGERSKPLPDNFNYSDFTLSVTGRRIGNNTGLILTCKDKDGKSADITYESQADITGLVALVNNFEETGGANFWFKDFSLSGSKTSEKPENTFGPILWSMYTLSKGNLNIMAQMPPIGRQDDQTVELHLRENNSWKKTDTESIDPASYTAHFRVNKWSATEDVPYQLVYKNNGKSFTYTGTIRQEPLNRPLRFGGLTCQEWGGYPYSPLINNLTKHDPDMLYFSGDQLYEGNGGYPIKREPEAASILSYLGKWYMFGWAFRDLMRDRPTVCTPDDHDIFQGNLWGEGGKTVSLDQLEKIRDAHGGYVQTAGMVNVVAKTQCGHLPPPVHPTPLDSGIETWYTDLVYGQVSFAIISDRMFKSGPEMVRSGKGRLDHLTTPVDKNELEGPHLTMLGEKQMQFLEQWVQDWQGANMKVLLSQTLFCNVGTHHGNDKMFLYGDMDSGGWPRQRRDEVLRLLRKACTFHINGDQHLPFIVQYSLDDIRDGGWTFCTPAISTGYIRWGQPDLMNVSFTQRPEHGLPNTGVYPDGFGNTNFIYAVGNPRDDFQNANRYLRAQNKSSGFGIITFDTRERTIKMEALRFLSDKDKPTPNDQFPGWPLTISQTDNDGRKPVAYLPKLHVNKPDQVVRIIAEKNQEIVSVIRLKGDSYQPGVFEEGAYKLIVGEGSRIKEIKNIKASKSVTNKILKVIV